MWADLKDSDKTSLQSVYVYGFTTHIGVHKYMYSPSFSGAWKFFSRDRYGFQFYQEFLTVNILALLNLCKTQFFFIKAINVIYPVTFFYGI
jgi:hypothetical protein